MKKGTRRSSGRGQPNAARIDRDEILPEYDFSGGKRNRFAAGGGDRSTVVELDPDVAAAFPDAASVNSALRALAEIIQQHAVSPPTRRPRATKPRVASQ